MSGFQWNFSNSLQKSDSAKTGCWGFSDQRLSYKNTNLTGQILFMECQLLVHSLMLLWSLCWFSTQSWGALVSPRNPSEGRTSPWAVRFCSRDLCLFCCVTTEFCEAAELNGTFWEESEQKTNPPMGGFLAVLYYFSASGRGSLFISSLLLSFFIFLTSFLFILGHFQLINVTIVMYKFIFKMG